MEKGTKDSNAAATPAAPLFDDSANKAAPKRTFGLRAFDAFLYPGVTNVGVFVISVFATYLTKKGSSFGREGSDARAFGTWMQARGDGLEKFFTNRFGMSPSAASNSRMVFWSFFDGSLLAPLVKKFEDNREEIAKTIDQVAGTTPDDDSVYKAEPKQSWGSVLGGRLVTAIPVVLTAVQLEKKGADGLSLNEKWLTIPGIKLGNWFAKANPTIAAKFSKETFHDLSKVILFEAFYTSVCTTGLYITSRAIASFTGNVRKTSLAYNHASPTQSEDTTNSLRLSELMHSPPPKPEKKATPYTALAGGEKRHAEPLQSREHAVGAS